jgi:hypothetical protein
VRSRVQQSVDLALVVQRYCALCGQTFEIERKVGRPRKYCLECSPAGFQVVKVPHQTRVKLRRRPSLFPRLTKINKGVSFIRQMDESA